MSKGQLIKVRLYGGQTATRRVVAVKRDVVVICSDEEYQNASLEGREPEGLGFPIADIMGDVQPEEAGRKTPGSVAARLDQRSMAGD